MTLGRNNGNHARAQTMMDNYPGGLNGSGSAVAMFRKESVGSIKSTDRHLNRNASQDSGFASPGKVLTIDNSAIKLPTLGKGRGSVCENNSNFEFAPEH